MPDSPNTMTMPYRPPRETRCARCDDGVITQPGLACCDLCIEAAHRAITLAGPGVVVTAAMFEAARHG